MSCTSLNRVQRHENNLEVDETDDAQQAPPRSPRARLVDPKPEAIDKKETKPRSGNVAEARKQLLARVLTSRRSLFQDARSLADQQPKMLTARARLQLGFSVVFLAVHRQNLKRKVCQIFMQAGYERKMRNAKVGRLGSKPSSTHQNPWGTIAEAEAPEAELPKERYSSVLAGTVRAIMEARVWMNRAQERKNAAVQQKTMVSKIASQAEVVQGTFCENLQGFIEMGKHIDDQLAMAQALEAKVCRNEEEFARLLQQKREQRQLQQEMEHQKRDARDAMRTMTEEEQKRAQEEEKRHREEQADLLIMLAEKEHDQAMKAFEDAQKRKQEVSNQLLLVRQRPNVEDAPKVFWQDGMKSDGIDATTRNGTDILLGASPDKGSTGSSSTGPACKDATSAAVAGSGSSAAAASSAGAAAASIAAGAGGILGLARARAGDSASYAMAVTGPASASSSDAVVPTLGTGDLVIAAVAADSEPNSTNNHGPATIKTAQTYEDHASRRNSTVPTSADAICSSGTINLEAEDTGQTIVGIPAAVETSFSIVIDNASSYTPPTTAEGNASIHPPARRANGPDIATERTSSFTPLLSSPTIVQEDAENAVATLTTHRLLSKPSSARAPMEAETGKDAMLSSPTTVEDSRSIHKFGSQTHCDSNVAAAAHDALATIKAMEGLDQISLAPEGADKIPPRRSSKRTPSKHATAAHETLAATKAMEDLDQMTFAPEGADKIPPRRSSKRTPSKHATAAAHETLAATNAMEDLDQMTVAPESAKKGETAEEEASLDGLSTDADLHPDTMESTMESDSTSDDIARGSPLHGGNFSVCVSSATDRTSLSSDRHVSSDMQEAPKLTDICKKAQQSLSTGVDTGSLQALLAQEASKLTDIREKTQQSLLTGVDTGSLQALLAKAVARAASDGSCLGSPAQVPVAPREAGNFRRRRMQELDELPKGHNVEFLSNRQANAGNLDLSDPLLNTATTESAEGNRVFSKLSHHGVDSLSEMAEGDWPIRTGSQNSVPTLTTQRLFSKPSSARAPMEAGRGKDALLTSAKIAQEDAENAVALVTTQRLFSKPSSARAPTEAGRGKDALLTSATIAQEDAENAVPALTTHRLLSKPSSARAPTEAGRGKDALFRSPTMVEDSRSIRRFGSKTHCDSNAAVAAYETLAATKAMEGPDQMPFAPEGAGQSPPRRFSKRASSKHAIAAAHETLAATKAIDGLDQMTFAPEGADKSPPRRFSKRTPSKHAIAPAHDTLAATKAMEGLDQMTFAPEGADKIPPRRFSKRTPSKHAVAPDFTGVQDTLRQSRSSKSTGMRDAQADHSTTTGLPQVECLAVANGVSMANHPSHPSQGRRSSKPAIGSPSMPLNIVGARVVQPEVLCSRHACKTAGGTLQTPRVHSNHVPNLQGLAIFAGGNEVGAPTEQRMRSKASEVAPDEVRSRGRRMTAPPSRFRQLSAALAARDSFGMDGICAAGFDNSQGTAIVHRRAAARRRHKPNSECQQDEEFNRHRRVTLA